MLLLGYQTRRRRYIHDKGGAAFHIRSAEALAEARPCDSAANPVTKKPTRAGSNRSDHAPRFAIS